MRPNSLSSDFVFNLPTDFIPNFLLAKYEPIITKNHFQYESILDYINSTIKEIVLPGLSIETPSQTIKRGKKINYKPVTNINDIVSSKQIDIIFRSVDSHFNYFIMYDIFNKHYLNVDFVNFVEPITYTALDIYKDTLFRVNFREVILTDLSENRFLYNEEGSGSEKTFTLSFTYNFIDVDFLLDKENLSDKGSLMQSDVDTTPNYNPLNK